MGCFYTRYTETKDVVLTDLDIQQKLYHDMRNNMKNDLMMDNRIVQFISLFNKNMNVKLEYNATIDKQIGILTIFIKYNNQINKIHGFIKNNAIGINKIQRNLNNTYTFNSMTSEPTVHEMIMAEVNRLNDGLSMLNNHVILIDNKFIEHKIVQYKQNKYIAYQHNPHHIIDWYNKFKFVSCVNLIEDVIHYIRNIYINIFLEKFVTLTRGDVANIILSIRLQ